MKIKQLFTKSIEREIKGVIKVSQNDDENIRQELEEYVITKELQRHFADFFASYKKGITGSTDKMGVWISGFFGSGKSHFLKILSYLLENKLVEGKRALDYFIDDQKIKDEFVLADMKLAASMSSDVILFNIDSRSGMADTQNNKEAILLVFIKMFNEHLGFYSANPHIAELERALCAEGRYEAFKQAFASIRNKAWEDSRHQFRFIQDQVCHALVDIGYMSMEAARNTCESFTAPYNMDIHTFAKLVHDHIQTKEKNHHVVFLVDEIGQYIGEKTDLMLNLQTLAEDLGTVCKGKAWIIVTSQQDIDSITKTKGNDFSKIQGRFDTRLSLSSANVDEVIQKRILDKTEAGMQTLQLLYDEKETILKNLILFNDGIEKRLYANRTHFAEVYPFVPYQFHLLGSVLTSIRTHGASGKHLAEGERSMLALFKESAEGIKDEQEGTIVPFNSFYDALEQFLDHSHKGVISRAYGMDSINPFKQEKCFTVDVLKVLFMIKYVKEIKPNIENITTLLVSNIDDDRLELKSKVEVALQILIKQTLVQKNSDQYVFLTNEEQEINKEIESQLVDPAHIIMKVSEMIFDSIYEEKRYRYPKYQGRYVFGFNQLVDDRPHKANQNHDISLHVLTPNHEKSTDETTLRLLSGASNCILVVLPENRAFLEEIEASIKIEKYLRLNPANVNPKFEQIKQAKSQERNNHIKNAEIFLRQALKEAAIYMNGDQLAIGAKEVSTRLDEAIGKLVNIVYNKLSYMDTIVNEQQIMRMLRGTEEIQVSLDQQVSNYLALKEVSDYMQLNALKHTKTSLKTIADRFMRAPYGFIEDDVQWLIVRLFKDAEIGLFYNSEVITAWNRSADEIYRYVSRKENQERLLIEKREKASEKCKKIVKTILHELFHISSSSDDDDALMNEFMTATKDFIHGLREYENKAGSYPGKQVVKDGQALLTQISAISSSMDFYHTIQKMEQELRDFAENFEQVHAFFNGEQVAIWDKATSFMFIYEDSKSYIVDTRISEVMAQVKLILHKAVPYRDIKQLPALLEEFILAYNALLKEKAEPMIKMVEDARNRVASELEGKACKEQFAGEVAKAFDGLLEKVKTINNISRLQSIRVEADNWKIRFLNDIRREEANFYELNANTAGDSLFVSEDMDEQAIKTKKQKTISIKAIAMEHTWVIESDNDVDRYLNMLRQRLVQNLDDDTVLHVEI